MPPNTPISAYPLSFLTPHEPYTAHAAIATVCALLRGFNEIPCARKARKIRRVTAVGSYFLECGRRSREVPHASAW